MKIDTWESSWDEGSTTRQVAPGNVVLVVSMGSRTKEKRFLSKKYDMGTAGGTAVGHTIASLGCHWLIRAHVLALGMICQ